MTAQAAFEFDGDDDLGVVLVHGFTGTPFEIRPLGELLHRDGFTVHAPLLPGHGTSIDDLDRTTWRDWADAVERAADAMGRRCARVAVVGQSLGGLLRRVRAIPKLGSDLRDRRARAANPTYRAIPVRALGQLLAFMRIV
ncbi:MAG TPA: alpha/beta fold hydrolase, partial [Kofleriaceae bacterium]|nr:alpha/beta fold hydrolase [Kofleriaceae bacterium]